MNWPAFSLAVIVAWVAIHWLAQVGRRHLAGRVAERFGPSMAPPLTTVCGICGEAYPGSACEPCATAFAELIREHRHIPAPAGSPPPS